ncbi:DUF1127 domain-containing protein [Microvirga sp. VF16]|uniref:DUF1127 domain-containing protein n=1 Tax=Microvirga sp. VF16 TaxID=2807101 RepID=UPI00193E3354|nr:DUF1127 domain-containing protein [Microvirga sp. VF16]
MFVAFLLSRIRAYQRYRASVRELLLYSEHELDDLGISRNEIDAVTRSSYASARAARPSNGCMHPPPSKSETTL